MKRYFIDITYRGSNYSGWQIQPKDTTIQQTIEDAIFTITRKKISILGAGRTDAGVHARKMIAHLDLDMDIAEAEQLIYKLNRLLPKDISINSIREVKADAHARFDAVSRTYHYIVSYDKDPFMTGLYTRIYRNLDFDKMNEAANLLIGKKDFTSFSKLHTDVKTNICTITEAYWMQKDDKWIFVITADRFLRNMVRAIVGTLMLVGSAKIGLEDFYNIIESKDRALAGSSADSDGLYLVDVKYPY